MPQGKSEEPKSITLGKSSYHSIDIPYYDQRHVGYHCLFLIYFGVFLGVGEWVHVQMIHSPIVSSQLLLLRLTSGPYHTMQYDATHSSFQFMMVRE